MYVYFVRHGHSTLGEEKKYQFPDSSLSEQGRQESLLLADRLSSLRFDIFISSPHKRALETANIINSYHNKSVIVSELFKETKRPSEIEGKSKDDPFVISVLEQIAVNENKGGLRYSDEESFVELRERGIRALEYLIKINKEKIIVATHGDILKIIVSVMQHGEEVELSLYNTFRAFAPTNTTGVTVCYYGSPKYNRNGKKLWYLISWNDHIHLMK